MPRASFIPQRALHFAELAVQAKFIKIRWAHRNGDTHHHRAPQQQHLLNSSKFYRNIQEQSVLERGLKAFGCWNGIGWGSWDMHTEFTYTLPPFSGLATLWYASSSLYPLVRPGSQQETFCQTTRLPGLSIRGLLKPNKVSRPGLSQSIEWQQLVESMFRCWGPQLFPWCPCCESAATGKNTKRVRARFSCVHCISTEYFT